MSGRKPTSAKMIDADIRKKATDEIEERIEAEPENWSQKFDVPEYLLPEEVVKWHEVIGWIRATENSPNSDMDIDTIVNYCKCWVRCMKTDKVYQENPDDKENYKQMMENWKLLARLKSDLMLDPVSRARMGVARYQAKKKQSAMLNILNRQGD